MNKTDENNVGFTRRILGLISDPAFIKFIHIQGEPTFFTIVGRTHYERWHSCFLGWLFDPNGSHLLSDYVLSRILLLLLDDKCLKPETDIHSLLIETLPLTKFNNIVALPNEVMPTETSIKGVGRFDVFITGNIENDSNSLKGINVLLELKIDSQIRGEQSKKYADWLIENHPNDLNILIYLLPELLSTSKATVGDERWFCLDYQIIHDKLLLPILDHPNLSDRVKPFIIQYIKNLKKRHRGIKMAITNEEKQLALTLYEKYGDVFESIFEALQETDKIDYDLSEAPVTKGRESGRLAVNVDNKNFVGKDVKDLFKNVLKYLVESGHVAKVALPWGTGTRRYILSNLKRPAHPNGREFFVPIRYKEYSMESHYALRTSKSNEGIGRFMQEIRYRI